MSGGHLSFIQQKETDALLNDAIALEEIEYASKYLAQFGEVAANAIVKNDAALAKLRALRERLQREIEELDVELKPLRGVWRALDHRGTNDIGDADVIAVLNQFNEGQG